MMDLENLKKAYLEIGWALEQVAVERGPPVCNPTYNLCPSPPQPYGQQCYYFTPPCPSNRQQQYQFMPIGIQPGRGALMEIGAQQAQPSCQETRTCYGCSKVSQIATPI